MQELEEIVAALEKSSVSLDESVKLFERGEALKRRCDALLKEAEARIEKIAFGEDGKPSGLRAARFGIRLRAESALYHELRMIALPRVVRSPPSFGEGLGEGVALPPARPPLAVPAVGRLQRPVASDRLRRVRARSDEPI